MAFHVGQKVVCVDVTSPPLRGPGRNHLFKLGGVYTIAAMSHDIVDVLQFAEVPTHVNGVCFWSQALRFRPLVERSTDTGMAILRKVADDASKKRERVDHL